MSQLTILVVSLLSLVALFSTGTHAHGYYSHERDPVDPTDPTYQSLVDDITPELYSSLELSPADYRFSVSSLSAAREIYNPDVFYTGGSRPFFLEFKMYPINIADTIGRPPFMACSATVAVKTVPPPTGSYWEFVEGAKGPEIECIEAL